MCTLSAPSKKKKQLLVIVSLVVLLFVVMQCIFYPFFLKRCQHDLLMQQLGEHITGLIMAIKMAKQKSCAPVVTSVSYPVRLAKALGSIGLEVINYEVVTAAGEMHEASLEVDGSLDNFRLVGNVLQGVAIIRSLHLVHRIDEGKWRGIMTIAHKKPSNLL